MDFKELFKAELAVRGITGKKADQIVEAEEKCGIAAVPLSAVWEEEKHPRAEDGKFASAPGAGASERKMNRPKNFGPFGEDRHEHMHQDEAERWDRIGKKGAYDKRLTKKKAEIAKLKKKQSWFKEGGETYNRLQSEIVKSQRELAELERDIKLEKRKGIEGKVSARVNAKKIKQYQDLDDEIDYIEEKYADRNPESPTQGEVVFPKTKRGEKQKAKYERLKVEREELNDEIDWELAESQSSEDDDE